MGVYKTYHVGRSGPRRNHEDFLALIKALLTKNLASPPAAVFSGASAYLKQPDRHELRAAAGIDSSPTLLYEGRDHTQILDAIRNAPFHAEPLCVCFDALGDDPTLWTWLQDNSAGREALAVVSSPDPIEITVYNGYEDVPPQTLHFTDYLIIGPGSAPVELTGSPLEPVVAAYLGPDRAQAVAWS
jgi:hypothetical protein